MSDESIERKQALQTVGLGMDAEVFVGSPLGRKMIARAQEQAIDAMDRLKNIKRSDYADSATFEAAVGELQLAIAQAENFELWLAEIIEDGRLTERLIQDQEATD